MKNHTLLLMIGLALLVFSCQSTEGEQEKLPPEVESLMDKIRQAHAPDKRVALFDVTAEKAGDSIRLSGESNLPEALTALEEGLEEAGIPYANYVLLLPDTALRANTYGVVQLSACNIRSEPRHSAELSTQSTLGTPLRVYKKDGGWYLVQTPDGYLGWLDSGGFALMSEEEFAAWEEAEKVVYLPDLGFSKAAPSPEAPRVSDLLAGNILAYLGSEGGYAAVQYPDGRQAYIPNTDVMSYEMWLASRQPDADHIIQTAFEFMGRPYLWGGTSGKGVDCSGFTKTVFYLNGLILPRDASQQVHVGEAVDTDTTLVNLQAGDLLFFGSKATEEKPERITHVAIYLGDGKIIHSSEMVQTESMRRGDPDFNEYRLRTFVRARRMLSNIGKNGVVPIPENSFYQEM